MLDIRYWILGIGYWRLALSLVEGLEVGTLTRERQFPGLHPQDLAILLERGVDFTIPMMSDYSQRS